MVFAHIESDQIPKDSLQGFLSPPSCSPCREETQSPMESVNIENNIFQAPGLASEQQELSQECVQSNLGLGKLVMLQLVFRWEFMQGQGYTCSWHNSTDAWNRFWLEIMSTGQNWMLNLQMWLVSVLFWHLVGKHSHLRPGSEDVPSWGLVGRLLMLRFPVLYLNFKGSIVPGGWY